MIILIDSMNILIFKAISLQLFTNNDNQIKSSMKYTFWALG